MSAVLLPQCHFPFSVIKKAIFVSGNALLPHGKTVNHMLASMPSETRLSHLGVPITLRCTDGSRGGHVQSKSPFFRHK